MAKDSSFRARFVYVRAWRMSMRHLLCALVLVMPPIALAATPAAPVVLEAEGPGGSLPEGIREVPVNELKAQASSTLCEGKGAKRACHGPERLVDDQNATAWCEGAKGDGTGESVTIELQAPQEVVALEVVPYYAKDMRRASSNARLGDVVLEVGTQRFEVAFPDHIPLVSGQNPEEDPNSDGPCGDETCVITQDERIASGESYFVTLPAPVKAQKVRLELRSTHAGDKHSDTCMSALKLHVRRAP